MAILSDVDIKKALKRGEIKIDPQPAEDQIGAGSVDVTLSNEFWKMKGGIERRTFDLKSVSQDDVYEEQKADAIIIRPRELILAKTLERITLPPNICGWIQGRSRYARLGITAHVASSFIQPGSDNRQVLEVVNLSPFPVTLHAGMRICQIIFEKTESRAERPYVKIGRFAKQ